MRPPVDFFLPSIDFMEATGFATRFQRSALAPRNWLL